MRFPWPPVGLVLAVLPSGIIAADGPIYTYTPATANQKFLASDDHGGSAVTWQYWSKGTTFQYNTTSPDSANWIGIFYSFGGGPANGTKVMDPVKWVYAPKKQGKVRIDTTKLAPGAYEAHLLAKDGYGSLASPTTFTVGERYEVRWFTKELWTREVREGEEFSYDVSKMSSAAGDPENKFALVYCTSCDGQMKVTEDGVLQGTPNKRFDRVTKMAVKVVTRNNLSYFLEIRMPVKGPDVPLVDKLKVISMNMWYGGTQVDDYHAKQVDFIASSRADIVGLQETNGIHALRLAQALGWWAYETWDASVISKYPIAEVLDSTTKTAAVRIALDGDRRQVIVWGAHMGYTQYGPYGFCFDGKSHAEVMRMEDASGRTAQAKELSEALKPQVENSSAVPVILTGDFNSPSHLDWTEGAEALHCGAGNVSWPSSLYPVQAGMRDSYREVHPDPAKDPGVTWSPIYLTNSDYGGRDEPLDRIDFIYYAGAGLKPNESEAFMFDETMAKAEPKHKDNYWTSDHRAVITNFVLEVNGTSKSTSTKA